MKARLPWVLFAVSLALNIAFMGGWAWGRMHPPRGGVFQHAARGLSLDDRQRDAFQNFLKTQRANGQLLREKNRPLLDSVRGEWAKQNPDEAAVEQLLDTTDANRRAFRQQTIRAMNDFLRTLTPEQREQFLRGIQEREHHGPRRP
jgi:Spy/CpxP family protein refolding chaperone